MLFSVETSTGPSAASVLWHAAYDIGAIGLLGVWVVRGWILREPSRLLGWFTAAAWTLTGLGAAGLAALHRAALGTGYTAFLGTHLGHAALIRFLPLLLAHEGMLAAAIGRGRIRTAGVHAIGAGAALSVFGHVLATHAAGGSWAPLKTSIETAHIAAIGAWMGGLAVLLFAIKGEADDAKASAVRRFSWLAGIAIAVVALSGFARALFEINSVHALVTTTYGRLVILKTELLIGIATLGVVNRYRHVPAVSTSLRGLRRAGVGEIAIAVVVISLSGLLAGTVPAREAVAAEAPRQISVQRIPGDATNLTLKYSDGTSMNVSIEAGSKRSRIVEVHMTFFDSRGNEHPIRDVSLTATEAGQTVVRATARRFTPGHFIADLKLREATWNFTLVAHAEDGTEVHGVFSNTVRFTT